VGGYILRRVLYSIPVLAVSSFLIFSFVSTTTDPLEAVKLLPNVNRHAIALVQKQNHLDQPIVVRYGYWVCDVFTNDFGRSIVGERPILPDLLNRLEVTLQLIVAAQLPSLLVALIVGVYSAVRQYSVFDYTATTLSFLGLAIPVFWLGLILQIVFTNIFLRWHVRIFYTGSLSSVDPGNGVHFLIDRVQHLVLPVVTLTIISVAGFSRFLRDSMLDAINADYVRTARAKGVVERRAIFTHALRNALIPLRDAGDDQLRLALRRNGDYGDDLRPARDGAVLHRGAQRRRDLRDHGLADDHGRDGRLLQSHRGSPTRRSRSAGSPRLTQTSRGSGCRPQRIEPLADGRARIREHARVAEQLVPGLGVLDERVQLEGDSARVGTRVELAELLGLLDRVLQVRVPARELHGDPFPDGARAVLELGRGGREEAAAGEDLALDVVEEAVEERPDAGDPARGCSRGLDHLADEDARRVVDGRELELFLRAEVREQAALAHARRLGQAADRERLQTLLRRERRRHVEDGVARPLPFG
jgi:peptide/nickel transport system permease protein